MTSRCTLASAQRGLDMLAPYPRRALGLLHRARADSLVRNSVLIMVTTVVNSLLGYVFWVVAARTYTAAAVGLVTALISAMSLTSMLSSLGTGQTLLQLLPRQRDPAQWWLVFMAALSVGIAGGLLGGILVVVGLPVISHQFAVVRDNLWLAGSFITAVAMWTVAQQLDLTFVAERRAGLMLVRNAFFAVIRFVPLAISALAGTATALVLLTRTPSGACSLACWGSRCCSCSAADVCRYEDCSGRLDLWRRG